MTWATGWGGAAKQSTTLVVQSVKTLESASSALWLPVPGKGI